MTSTAPTRAKTAEATAPGSPPPATPSAATSDLADPPPDCAVGFRGDVQITPVEDGFALVAATGAFAVRRPGTELEDALRRMTSSQVSLAESLEPLSAAGRAQLSRIVAAVRPLLARYLLAGTRKLVRVEPTAQGASYDPGEVPPGALVRLSKFALCRSKDGVLVLESPLARHRAVLLDPAAQALVAALGTATSSDALTTAELPATAVTELLSHLIGAGLAEVGRLDGGLASFSSDTDPVLRQWDFHDLLLHSRSRSGRFDEPFGGIFPYRGEIEPQPAVKDPPAGPRIALYRPSWEEIQARDPSLTTVIEGRESIRSYGEQPLTAEQLGEFLYRVARVRAWHGPIEGAPYEVTTRPYPCGGAAYELELYLAVRRCVGLEPGIYYYDPNGHQLVLINAGEADRQAMLRVAWVSSAMQANPDVLITMASRFQRLSWKYRGIAYAVSLKHAGVLYQTMYLVATAMGLAPCGLGSGDSDLAARALGLDYLRESTVGDFILGSRPEVRPADPTAVDPVEWRPVNDHEWRSAAQAELAARRA
ncbi:MAG TPA: SagB family peptide dehydrogenase [Streptosporangiaceae bacterium]|nr:SagB family peptide dehydrogenase [Streptosporangiaceae bacterium]